MEYSFGNWVRRRRKALDLTQQALADHVGCSISLIFKIESDERRPSRQMADLLARHLQIPTDQHDLFLKVARQEKRVEELEPDSPLSEPKPAAPDLFSETLPLPLTSIVGREHELRAIIRQLQDPACRLLTLMGPGGVGKTRLALEVAHQKHEFEHGTCFVSLVGTSAVEFIVPAVADALGFAFSGATDLKTQLFNYLTDKRLLLVLDNLEHLLNGIEILDGLLEHAPSVKLLVTSREQLNLRAEWVFEVQGLPVPSDMELRNLESNSAAALFIQRAKKANANFTPSPENLPAITHICQLVEGLPLGLELAATWVRMMSLQEIADEIERNLDFLTTTTRDVPQRHRSIRAVFDYSWNLLSDAEQSALRQLAVFRGGFSRDSAESVAGVTLIQLLALVDKSLLRHISAQTSWYDFHELIRQYAEAKLQEHPEGFMETRERHADYYADLLHQWKSRIQGSGQHEILLQTSLEIDNLRLAWDWMVAHRQTSNLEKSLDTMFVLHDIRNWLHQGSTLFEKAVEAVQSLEFDDGKRNGHAILLGELMVGQGHMCWHLGQTQRARDLLQQSLQMLRPHRGCAMLAEALLYLSILEHSQGNFQTARRLAEECVSLNREQGRQTGTGYALSNLGMICITLGEYETAYGCIEEGTAVMQLIEYSRGIAVNQTRLGAAALRLGKFAEAQRLLDESLEIARQLRDRWGIGNALNYLGLLEFAKGNLERAEELIRESATLFREDGDQIMLASILTDLGYILIGRTANGQAWQVFWRALELALQSQAIPVVLSSLAGIAALQAKEGATELALELAMYSVEHPSSSQQTRDAAQQLRVELEGQLVPGQIETVQTRVRSKTLEDLVKEILARSA